MLHGIIPCFAVDASLFLILFGTSNPSTFYMKMFLHCFIEHLGVHMSHTLLLLIHVYLEDHPLFACEDENDGEIDAEYFESIVGYRARCLTTVVFPHTPARVSCLFVH